MKVFENYWGALHEKVRDGETPDQSTYPVDTPLLYTRPLSTHPLPSIHLLNILSTPLSSSLLPLSTPSTPSLPPLHPQEAAAKRAAFLAKTAASTSQKDSSKGSRKGAGSRSGTRSGTASASPSRGGTGGEATPPPPNHHPPTAEYPPSQPTLLPVVLLPSTFPIPDISPYRGGSGAGTPHGLSDFGPLHDGTGTHLSATPNPLAGSPMHGSVDSFDGFDDSVVGSPSFAGNPLPPSVITIICIRPPLSLPPLHYDCLPSGGQPFVCRSPPRPSR